MTDTTNTRVYQRPKKRTKRTKVGEAPRKKGTNLRGAKTEYSQTKPQKDHIKKANNEMETSTEDAQNGHEYENEQKDTTK